VGRAPPLSQLDLQLSRQFLKRSHPCSWPLLLLASPILLDFQVACPIERKCHSQWTLVRAPERFWMLQENLSLPHRALHIGGRLAYDGMPPSVLCRPRHCSSKLTYFRASPPLVSQASLSAPGKANWLLQRTAMRRQMGLLGPQY
jgi:hypothetical protein